MTENTLIAIIAASSALSGVIISQVITLLASYMNRRHEKNVLLRNKYEELMFHFSDSFGWMVEINNSMTKEELFEKAQSMEARKALSLCLLYFPDLVDDANKYVFSMVEYYKFVVDIFNADIPHNAGAQALAHDKGIDLMNRLFGSKVTLENAIVDKSPAYTKA